MKLTKNEFILRIEFPIPPLKRAFSEFWQVCYVDKNKYPTQDDEIKRVSK